jgi:uncharacterized integral membrane protein
VFASAWAPHALRGARLAYAGASTILPSPLPAEAVDCCARRTHPRDGCRSNCGSCHQGETMNLRNFLLAAALALLASFALLNWTAFTAPTTLRLFFTEVQAPLGLIMLVVTGLFSALFVVYIVFQQAGVIVEARRYAKELKAQRELADKAEASRFTEMRAFLDGELRRIEARAASETRELGARIDAAQRQLLETLAESTRTLSAYVGEIDDKLDRALGPAAAPRD